MPTFTRDMPPSRDRGVTALGRTLILISEGTRKYERRFGVPLSRILLAGWLSKGHLKRAGAPPRAAHTIKAQRSPAGA